VSDTGDHGWLKQGSTSSDDVKQSYDSWATTYDSDLAAWDYRAPAQVAGMLRDAIPVTAEILDAGCGTGLAGRALRDAGFTGPIDGMDLSPPSLEQADQLGVYRSVRQVNLQDVPLPLPDESYDAVICVGVLTYVPDSEAVLREFARIVRQGRTVLLTQRDDVFRERDFGATISALVDEGVFSDATVTEPKPYLPNNPDFGSETLVIYVKLTRG